MLAKHDHDSREVSGMTDNVIYPSYQAPPCCRGHVLQAWDGGGSWLNCPDREKTSDVRV